ncbi:hypothetical protein BGW80DRAFT_1463470 [Lactifluus volemus]|nr:hypothetical protein BGW80DRAFT_1463470 [Lactifluus volemus]
MKARSGVGKCRPSSGPLPPAKRPTSLLPVRTGKPTPPITILTNPARAHPTSAQAKKAQTPQPEDISALSRKRAPVPAQPRRLSAVPPVAAAEVETRNRFQLAAPNRADPAKSEKKPTLDLPEIIIHDPYPWDLWIDVHYLGTSNGEMLDVPELNRRCKMHDEDLARYYPKDFAAQRTMRRLRSMLRTGRRLAKAHHLECVRQAEQITAAASRRIDTAERSLAVHWPPAPQSAARVSHRESASIPSSIISRGLGL